MKGSKMINHLNKSNRTKAHNGRGKVYKDFINILFSITRTYFMQLPQITLQSSD